MTETRDPTSGELDNLWKVANEQLPKVIDIYGGAARGMRRITETQVDAMGRPMSRSDEEAFERSLPPPPGAPHYAESSGPGPVWPAWEAARNEFHHLMALVASNLAEAANGFNEAYASFKDTDEENSIDIKKDIDWPEDYESEIDQPTIESDVPE